MIVYIYTFPNGKKYVGQTSRPLKVRANNGEGYKSSPAVYNAIKKYGWNNIKIETHECSSKDEMDSLEKYYIKLYNTTDNNYGYNLTYGGEGTIKYDREVIIDLWNKGYSVGEICKEVGCLQTTVTDILKSFDLYNAEEVDRRGRVVLSKTGKETFNKYYSTPEKQLERINNGLKGAKARSKEVYVFLDKEQQIFVGRYESGRQAAKALDIDHSIPSYAITHNHYGKGYYFFLKEELLDKLARECTMDQVK